MKILYVFCYSLLISGCCCIQKPDESLKDVSEYPNTDKKELLVSKDFPNKIIACRDNNSMRTKSIVNAAIKSNKDIVLYFHGGLSSQEYMVNELGPALIKSMFESEPARNNLYPIFMNYDANPLGIFKEFFDSADEILRDKLYKEFLRQLSDAIGINVITQSNNVILSDKQRVDAANLIERFKKGYHSVLNQDDVFNNQEYYINLLKLKKLPNEFVINDSGDITNELSEIALSIKKIDSMFKSSKNSKSLIGLKKIDINTSALRVLRILARYVINSHHGYVATIQEEILDVIGVSEYGLKHWDMVKRHAKECFSENSNGRKIVDELLAKGVTINTLSHSAGSIPTAELIKYLDEQGGGLSLNQVVMIVPAINQLVFNKHVIDNKGGFEKLTAYILEEKYEKADMVLNKLLYSSSLLYAVSSLAEDVKTLDQMLLVEQHLKSDRMPYSNSIYRKLTCEKPEEIWSVFNDNKFEKYIYPFENTPNKAEAATHEKTKYPWVSKDLANHYLEKIIGDDSINTQFDEMSVKPIESQWTDIK